LSGLQPGELRSRCARKSPKLIAAHQMVPMLVYQRESLVAQRTSMINWLM
jgi:hypothetical protein